MFVLRSKCHQSVPPHTHSLIHHTHTIFCHAFSHIYASWNQLSSCQLAFVCLSTNRPLSSSSLSVISRVISIASHLAAHHSRWAHGVRSNHRLPPLVNRPSTTIVKGQINLDTQKYQNIFQFFQTPIDAPLIDRTLKIEITKKNTHRPTDQYQSTRNGSSLATTEFITPYSHPSLAVFCLWNPTTTSNTPPLLLNCAEHQKRKALSHVVVYQWPRQQSQALGKTTDKSSDFSLASSECT